MNKRLEPELKEFAYKGEKTPFSLGTLAVVVFCTVLLIIATFTKLDISHWWLFDKAGELSLGIKKCSLVPQIPVVILSAALLGARFGLLTIFLYLLIGFFLWPVFAFGGGLEYIKSYFFGYILGFFAAVIFSGRILSHRYDTKSMIYAAIIGVLSIHFCGILYSFILGFFDSSAYAVDFRNVFQQMAYDIIFSLFAIVVAKPLKLLLWLAMKNEVRQKRVEVKQAVQTEEA